MFRVSLLARLYGLTELLILVNVNLFNLRFIMATTCYASRPRGRLAGPF